MRGSSAGPRCLVVWQLGRSTCSRPAALNTATTACAVQRNARISPRCSSHSYHSPCCATQRSHIRRANTLSHPLSHATRAAATVSTPCPSTRQVAATVSHIEHCMCAAEMLHSWDELDQWTLLYAKVLAKESRPEQLRILCSRLLGPPDVSPTSSVRHVHPVAVAAHLLPCHSVLPYDAMLSSPIHCGTQPHHIPGQTPPGHLLPFPPLHPANNHSLLSRLPMGRRTAIIGRL